MTLGDDAAGATFKGMLGPTGRALHYVRSGSGPALVLIHASPCSAKVMAPLQKAWGAHFTSFAFDLPGFGLSDVPEEDEVTIALLADRIAEGMRALGLGRAGLYGRHTGAGVAVEIARRHPDLAAFVLTDGLPIFAAPYDDARLEAYLPPIVPQRDGTHLAWAFFRYREQHMFWPWDKAGLANRADTDVPDLRFLYRGAVEMLEAAGTYAKVYRAAFRHDALTAIPEVTVPAIWGIRPGDSQHRTKRLYPEGASVREFSRDADRAAQEELAAMLTLPAPDPAPRHRVRFAPHGPARDYLPTRHGPVYARGNGEGGEVPTIFLHDLPGGIDLHLDDLTALGREGRVVGFDMAGNGESPLDGPATLRTWAGQVEDVAAFLGWPRIRLVAHGTAGVVAAEVARMAPGLVTSIDLRSPPLLPQAARRDWAAHVPDIAPVEDAGNFYRLWHHLRDQELWCPWYDRTIRAAKSTEPRIAPDRLHRRAVTMLKQPDRYAEIWRAVLAPDLAAMLADHSVPVRIASHPQDVFAFCNADAADLSASGRPVPPQ